MTLGLAPEQRRLANQMIGYTTRFASTDAPCVWTNALAVRDRRGGETWRMDLADRMCPRDEPAGTHGTGGCGTKVGACRPPAPSVW